MPELDAGAILEAHEIVLTAPKGFRPSDWVERLMNFDELEDLGVDLLYPKFTEQGEVLVLRVELLDPDAPMPKARQVVWHEVLSFAKLNGLVITVDGRLKRADPPAHQRVASAFEALGLSFEEALSK